MSDGRRLLLHVLFSAWVFVFGYAFVAPFRAGGDPTLVSAGLDRSAVYLGWQAIAGMVAIAVFGLGRSWPRGSSVRRLTVLPLIIAVLHVAVIGGMMLWSGGL